MVARSEVIARLSDVRVRRRRTPRTEEDSRDTRTTLAIRMARATRSAGSAKDTRTNQCRRRYNPLPGAMRNSARKTTAKMIQMRPLAVATAGDGVLRVSSMTSSSSQMMPSIAMRGSAARTRLMSRRQRARSTAVAGVAHPPAQRLARCGPRGTADEGRCNRADAGRCRSTDAGRCSLPDACRCDPRQSPKANRAQGTTPLRPVVVASRAADRWTRATRLPRVLRAEAEHARVHVGRGRLPPGRARNERLGESERDVVVHDVVNVDARGQPLVAQADDLLRAQIDLPDTRSIQAAGCDQVHGAEHGSQGPADLRRRSRQSRWRWCVVGRQGTRELIRALVRTVLEHGAEEH